MFEVTVDTFIVWERGGLESRSATVSTLEIKIPAAINRSKTIRR